MRAPRALGRDAKLYRHRTFQPPMTLLSACLRTCALLLCATLMHPAWAQGRVAAPAGASQSERQAVQWFNLLDRNGDGQITRGEARWAFRLDPRLERQFNEADSDHDGIVTEAEIRARAAQRKAERRARSAAPEGEAAQPPAVSRR